MRLILILLATSIPFVSFLQKTGTLILSGDVDSYDYNKSEFTVYFNGNEIGKFNQNGEFSIPNDQKLPLTIKHPNFSDITLNYFEFSKRYSSQYVPTTLTENAKARVNEEFKKEQLATCTKSARSELESILKDTVAYFDGEASFPGGRSNLMMYLAENVRYPQKCLEEGIQGKVYLSFIVEADGSITCIHIDKGVDYLMDREAYRCVKGFPKFKPAQRDGKSVASIYRIPISFRLN